MGRFLNGIICEAPQRFFTIVVSVFTYGVVILMPAFKKAKPIAFFAVASMWASVVMIVTLSMIYFGRRECRSDPLDHITCITNLALPTIGSGFSAYTFGFSVHASIPSFFASMKVRKDIYKTNSLAFGGALVFFGLPLTIFSYLAFGRGMLDSRVR
jgi:amino acid permease